MSSVLTVLAASVTTLAVTNLDEIFLLTVLFARRLPTRRIVAGQYLGFCSICDVALPRHPVRRPACVNASGL
jgi:cadmium resistance protein CadD (predicted permease)